MYTEQRNNVKFKKKKEEKVNEITSHTNVAIKFLSSTLKWLIVAAFDGTYLKQHLKIEIITMSDEKNAIKNVCKMQTNDESEILWQQQQPRCGGGDGDTNTKRKSTLVTFFRNRFPGADRRTHSRIFFGRTLKLLLFSLAHYMHMHSRSGSSTFKTYQSSDEIKI